MTTHTQSQAQDTQKAVFAYFSDIAKHDQGVELERQVQAYLDAGGVITRYGANQAPKSKPELIKMVHNLLKSTGRIDLNRYDTMGHQGVKLSWVIGQIKAQTGWKIAKLANNVGYKVMEYK